MSSKCPKCHKEYKNENTMRAHLYQDCGNNYQCGLCEYVCKRKYSLKQHQIWKHPLDTKTHNFPRLQVRYKCPNCPRRYKHSHHLKSHLKYECNKEPRFACPSCAKKFHYQFLLNAHMKQTTCSGCFIGSLQLLPSRSKPPTKLVHLQEYQPIASSAPGALSTTKTIRPAGGTCAVAQRYDIKKHVRACHPDREQEFEQIYRNSYYRKYPKQSQVSS
ncbi:hypothetical protein HUJ04_008542 [Dendroctonus ponderosae]|nr:hypothetical protein HUJ04_008542 [Dendroctonus ponderosae]